MEGAMATCQQVHPLTEDCFTGKHEQDGPTHSQQHVIILMRLRSDLNEEMTMVRRCSAKGSPEATKVGRAPAGATGLTGPATPITSHPIYVSK
jgi:hypothetical protein